MVKTSNNDNKTYSLSNELKAVIFAIQSLRKQYPNNADKIYLSNIVTFFKNKSNTSKINESLGIFPNFTREEIASNIDELEKLGLVDKHIGTRFAISVYFNDANYDAFIKSIEFKVKEDDLKAVVFAIRNIREKYPLNKGKVYISLINIFFKNKKNTKLINDQLGYLPSYTPMIIEQIIDKLVEQNVVSKHIGTRFAISVYLNDAVFEAYIHRNDLIINDDDLKAVAFAIKQVRIKYPLNKGKVYISNINIFFKNKKNWEKIKDELNGYLPIYTLGNIEKIIDVLVEKQFCIKQIGPRFGIYVLLNDEVFDAYIHRNDFVPTDDDFLPVLFAIRCLRKQYPRNKGKVYVSNINIFFKDKRNIKKIDNEFGRQFDCNKRQIEIIIDKLNELKIVNKHIGLRGATFVTLDDAAYIKHFNIKPSLDKELIVLGTLMTLNGRCKINTISDILLNDVSNYQEVDTLYWLDNYFKDRKKIENKEELKEIINKLIEKDEALEVNSKNYIKLTPKGQALYEFKLEEVKNPRFEI